LTGAEWPFQLRFRARRYVRRGRLVPSTEASETALRSSEVAGPSEPALRSSEVAGPSEPALRSSEVAGTAGHSGGTLAALSAREASLPGSHSGRTLAALSWDETSLPAAEAALSKEDAAAEQCCCGTQSYL